VLIKQNIDLRDDVAWGLTLLPRVERQHEHRGCTAAEADLDGDLRPLGQCHVLNEQADHPFALAVGHSRWAESLAPTIKTCALGLVEEHPIGVALALAERHADAQLKVASPRLPKSSIGFETRVRRIQQIIKAAPIGRHALTKKSGHSGWTARLA
jgi:hypothetical protein